jgi:hypothetical protein
MRRVETRILRHSHFDDFAICLHRARFPVRPGIHKQLMEKI